MTSNDRHLLSAVIQSNSFHVTHIAFCSDKITILHILDLEKNEIESHKIYFYFLRVLLLTPQTKRTTAGMSNE